MPAAILMVTNSLDDGSAGSLRAEIAIANSSTDDTVEFAAGLAPIVLTSGTELPLTQNMSILNLNASSVTIDGNATSRIFDVSNKATVTITNLTLTNGKAGASSPYGGAIYSNYSTLSVNNCLITGNNAPTGAAGGIWQRGGNLTIQNTTIANNFAGGEGGGIGIDDGATVTIQNSTIGGNSADNNSGVTNPGRGGGGIWSTDSTLTVQNSTISGNTVKVVPGAKAGYNGGGGIDFNTGSLTIKSTTIAGNTAGTVAGSPPAQYGGGIAIGTGNSTTTVTLQNTIVSGNSDATGANDLYRHNYTLSGTTFTPIVNASYCLIQSPGTAINNTNVGNIFNTDPKLGPLAGNGGPTQTRALLAGSSAIDKGNSALAPFPFDQRGTPFVRTFGIKVDIGAFEVQASALATVAGTLFIDYNANGALNLAEPGIAGMTIFLDANGNGALDPGEPSALTDVSGAFSLTNITPGTYTLSLAVLPAHGFLYTVASSGRSLVLAAGNNVNDNLGVVPISQVSPLTATAADLFAPHPNPDADTAFVHGLYHAILGRAAEPAGLAAWLGLLSSGGTPTQVTQGIWKSVEHRGQEVDAFYLTFLRRAADPPGRAAAINALMSGATEEQLTLTFLTSAEYGLLHPDNGSFVDALYLDVLSRAESGAGRAAAIAALGSGTTRAALAQAFVTSDESHARAVDSFYAVFLHRKGEAAGRATWLAALTSGSFTDGEVAQAFFPLPEFTADAASAVP